ncbi:MAG: hypothetical protein AAF903_08235 [Pseudomonadota bacterium]
MIALSFFVIFITDKDEVADKRIDGLASLLNHAENCPFSINLNALNSYASSLKILDAQTLGEVMQLQESMGAKDVTKETCAVHAAMASENNLLAE